MLKEIFKKKEKNDKILSSILDGYVDIKAYRYNENNEKELVYHDTGDNTVTDWMRQVIVQMLAGVSYGSQTPADGKFVANNHTAVSNKDGTLVSGDNLQYLFDPSNVSLDYITSSGRNPLYPTKVLFGTGKEYTSWDAFADENSENNSTEYSNKVNEYGDGVVATASAKFGTLISDNSNNYSATVGMQGSYVGGGALVKTITVNDPDTNSQLIETPANLAKRYGVVGAVKTKYLPSSSSDTTANDLLMPVTSEQGRLMKTNERGVGKPCFIYLKRIKDSNNAWKWSDISSDICVSGESVNNYLNRITFTVVMPAQRGSGNDSKYYPYNGYTLKQVGLFNDSLLESAEGSSSTVASKMPYGTMLAIKNIATFTKVAEEEIVFKWTLTI